MGGLAFAVAGLGLMGTPGTAGFISKWYLAVAAIDDGMYSVVFLIVASSLISVVYIGRITEVVWFREPSKAAAQAKETPLSMLIPLWLLVVATVYLGQNWRAGIPGCFQKRWANRMSIRNSGAAELSPAADRQLTANRSVSRNDRPPPAMC